MPAGGSSRGGGKVCEKRAHDNAALSSPPRAFHRTVTFSSSSSFSSVSTSCFSPTPSPPSPPPLSSPGGGCRGLIKNSTDDELPEDVGLPSLFSLFRSRSTSSSPPSSFTYTRILSLSSCTSPSLSLSLSASSIPFSLVLNFLALFVAFLSSLCPRPRARQSFSFFF